jgi:hypothetical protein
MQSYVWTPDWPFIMLASFVACLVIITITITVRSFFGKFASFVTMLGLTRMALVGFFVIMLAAFGFWVHSQN